MTATQQDFLNRSKFYKNVWNSKTRFFEPRYKNGSFYKLSKGERLNGLSNHYVEGDAWHYRFFAPHDVPGLMELFGGRDSFVKELDKFFKRS
jgi:putative alpha-1,2-mannosidase